MADSASADLDEIVDWIGADDWDRAESFRHATRWKTGKSGTVIKFRPAELHLSQLQPSAPHGDIIPARSAPTQPRHGTGRRPARAKKECAMAWISVLALLIGTMVTLSSIGAELNFRRSLELRDR
jgi:hypothetical protein